MQSSIDLSFASSLSPKDAIDYFTSKGHTISWNWQDTWQEANAKAFTVAKVTKLDVLQDIQSAVGDAIKSGKTLKQFQDELAPVLKKKGWWGLQEVDGPNGKEVVQLGSNRRLATIYRTNLQTAYMAGRHQGMIAGAKRRPFWQYIAVNDSRTRPDHSAMHGRIFRWDDPIWESLYPPNGWGCRCRVRALTQRQVDRSKLRVEFGAGKLKTDMRLVSEKTGELQPVTSYNYGGTGRQAQRFSPDVGWSYNPGRAAYQPNLDGYNYTTARQYVKGNLTGPAFKQWYGKIENLVNDRLTENPNLKVADLRRDSLGTLRAMGNQPVAILKDEHKAALGAKSSQVLLSAETLAKQVLHRANQDIDLDDYFRVQPTLEKPDLVIEDRQHHLLFYRVEGKTYKATVKVTQDGKEVYLQSFRNSNERQMARDKLKAKVIIDRTG